MMSSNKAPKALDNFYQIGYDVLNEAENNHIKGLFVSDCGILYYDTNSGNDSKNQQLISLLNIIQKINRKALQKDLMLTSSIAYGDFTVQERIETRRIGKAHIIGNAYIAAYLDNENGNPKIRPGQCRIIKNDETEMIIEDIKQTDNISEYIRQKQTRSKHYYYYWMVDNINDISTFDAKYKESEECVYAGMKCSLKEFHQS